eukprot:4679200-Prymnesium_polylepis.1
MLPLPASNASSPQDYVNLRSRNSPFRTGPDTSVGPEYPARGRLLQRVALPRIHHPGYRNPPQMWESGQNANAAAAR